MPKKKRTFRPPPTAKLADYEPLLKRLDTILISNPDDSTAQTALAVTSYVRKFYRPLKHQFYHDSIAAVMRNKVEVEDNFFDLYHFDRNQIPDHLKFQSHFSSLGNYLDFDWNRSGFEKSHEYFPVLLWVNTADDEESLIANVFCKLCTDQLGDQVLVSTFRSPTDGIMFRHVILPTVEPFEFRRNQKWQLTEYTTYELDSAARVNVTILFHESSLLKVWELSVTRLNTEMEDFEQEWAQTVQMGQKEKFDADVESLVNQMASEIR